VTHPKLIQPTNVKTPRKKKDPPRPILDLEKQRSSRLVTPGGLDAAGVNNIIVKFKDDNNTIISEEHKFLDTGGRRRIGHNKTFPNKVLNATKKYCKTYADLTRRERGGGGFCSIQLKLWPVVATRCC